MRAMTWVNPSNFTWIHVLGISRTKSMTQVRPLVEMENCQAGGHDPGQALTCIQVVEKARLKAMTQVRPLVCTYSKWWKWPMVGPEAMPRVWPLRVSNGKAEDIDPGQALTCIQQVGMTRTKAMTPVKLLRVSK
jgi:hypothetical protein